MKSKMTKCKAYGKEITSTVKNNPNYEKNNKKLILKNFWFLLIIILFAISIFLSIKENSNKVASIYSEPNKEKFEQATKATKAYWRFSQLYRDDIIEELIYGVTDIAKIAPYSSPPPVRIER